MQFTPLPLGFGFYQSSVTAFASQRCINWLPVVAEGPALSTRMLKQMPGIDLFSTLPEAEHRGSHQVDGVPYFVNGTKLYSLNVDGVYTDIGTITGSGRVSMASNATYLVIVVPGNTAYTYNRLTATLTVITDPDFNVSDSVGYKDGFFTFTKTDGSAFFNSELNYPTSYNALDTGTAEISPDRIVTQIIDRNELFILGTETVEIFQNIGGSGFPFQRIAGANIPKGCHAAFGVVQFDNTFSFVGGGLNERTAIWKVSGSSSAVKISTNTIDAEIQKFTAEEIADSFAGTMSIDGQILAFFTFESTRIDSRTFVYNATASALAGSSVWFELSTGVAGGRWNVESVVRAYGKILVADSDTGKVGAFNSDSLLDYGSPNLRQMTSSPFGQEGAPMFSGGLQVLFESGVGLTSGYGSDPVASLDYSDDGGLTWSSSTTRAMGKIGQYGRPCVWNRQGRFPVSRVIRISVASPVKANLIRMGATPEAGY